MKEGGQPYTVRDRDVKGPLHVSILNDYIISVFYHSFLLLLSLLSTHSHDPC